MLHSALPQLWHYLTTPSAPFVLCSVGFWILFVVFYDGLLLLRRRSRCAQLAYVVGFNLFCAFKANGALMLLLPATTAATWWLARRMQRTDSARARRRLLALALALALAPLLFFKYTDFLLATASDLLACRFRPLELLLPVGISFYTFQAIGYCADVYRRRFDRPVTLLEYTFFLTFFPLLLAGPIARAPQFFPQLSRARRISGRAVYAGLWLIIAGVLKKCLVADHVAQFADWVFDDPAAYSGAENAAAVAGYAIQIYCDFSGYSDISIGLAALVGIRLPDNFAHPYRARSLTEFWRRWHISLSTWFRDYVYIPLGGNRHGTLPMLRNCLATMLLAGLWHGASWMFVLWGAAHGAGLAAHKLALPLLRRLPDAWPVRALSWTLTFAFVAAAWVLFRAPDLATAAAVFRQLGGGFAPSELLAFATARPLLASLLAAGLAAQLVSPRRWGRLRARFVRAPLLVKWLAFALAAQAAVDASMDSVQPFIYSSF